MQSAKDMAQRINEENAAGYAIWRHGIKETYKKNLSFDDDYWQWIECERYTYYADGKVKTIGFGITEIRIFYDDKGRVCRREMYDGYNNHLAMTTIYEYDSVLDNLIICVDSGKYGREGLNIVRDADGNICKVNGFYTYDGIDIEKDYRMSVSYGTDGKAETIVKEDLSSHGEVEFTASLSDIIWENTDGQIYDLHFRTLTPNLFFGANRIKSAVYKDDNLSKPYTVNNVYDADGVSYDSSRSRDGECIYTSRYEKLDDFGSNKLSWYDKYYAIKDGNPIGKDGIDITIFDKFGFLLKSSLHYTSHHPDGDTEYTDSNIGEVVYDKQHGYPIEYTFIIGMTNEARREVYSDYKDVSMAGVADAEIEADADVEYYDLSGMRISQPSRGFYIVRKGNTSSKIFIR